MSEEIEDKIFWLLKKNDLEPQGDFAAELREIVSQQVDGEIEESEDACEQKLEDYRAITKIHLEDALEKLSAAMNVLEELQNVD